MAKEKKKEQKEERKSDKPRINVYTEPYNLSPGAREFFGGKLGSIEKHGAKEKTDTPKISLQELIYRRRQIPQKLFGGKIGFHGGKKTKVSAKQGSDVIKKMFGY